MCIQRLVAAGPCRVSAAVVTATSSRLPAEARRRPHGREPEGRGERVGEAVARGRARTPADEIGTATGVTYEEVVREH